jgi:SOS response regulatory protein OraA/RecX
MESSDEVVQVLTLALMLLTSWEDSPGELRRCWKGYDFDVLNALQEQGLIVDSRRAKSAYLTEDGVEHARQFLARLGIQDW